MKGAKALVLEYLEQELLKNNNQGKALRHRLLQ